MQQGLGIDCLVKLGVSTASGDTVRGESLSESVGLWFWGLDGSLVRDAGVCIALHSCAGCLLLFLCLLRDLGFVSG